MTDLAGAADEFRELAILLRQTGADDLRKELSKAISDAARPLGNRIQDVEHLKPYMPDRYAEILAEDLSVVIQRRTGTADPGIRLRAKGRRRSRHVARLNQGILTHPVFGRPEAEAAAIAHGRGWTWVSQNIRPRFFDDPTQAAGPEVRRYIEDAMHRITDRIYRRR